MTVNKRRENIQDSQIPGLTIQGSMNGLEEQVRRAFNEVDPNLTLIRMRPMEQQVAERLDQERSVAQLTGLFGLLALRLDLRFSAPGLPPRLPVRFACLAVIDTLCWYCLCSVLLTHEKFLLHYDGLLRKSVPGSCLCSILSHLMC